MDFNSKISIYLQLCSHYRNKIFSGELHPGGQLPSIRKIADEMHVNANTVQRAMTVLGREGLLESHKMKGYVVVTDAEKIEKQRQKFARNATRKFVLSMKAMGFNEQQIIDAITRAFDEDCVNIT